MIARPEIFDCVRYSPSSAAVNAVMASDAAVSKMIAHPSACGTLPSICEDKPIGSSTTDPEHVVMPSPISRRIFRLHFHKPCGPNSVNEITVTNADFVMGTIKPRTLLS